MNLRLISVILAFFCIIFGSAYSVTGLHGAQVVVTSRSKADFNANLIKAYEQVLVKLSGNSAIMSLPRIQNSLVKVNSLVSNYRFVQTAEPQTAQPKLELFVEFDANALNRVLQESGQTIWESERPVTLVILADCRSRGWNIYPDSANTVAPLLSSYAEHYGLKLIFPMMDLEDQDLLKDLRSGMSKAQLVALMDRYHVEAVLYGGVESDNPAYLINWRLWQKDQFFEWRSHASDEGKAVSMGINRLLEMYASQYGTMSSQKLESILSIRVSGVQSLIDFAQMLAAMKRISAVKRVTVKSVLDASVLIELAVLGGEEAFAQSSVGTRFLIENVASSDFTEPVLHYHWSRH